MDDNVFAVITILLVAIMFGLVGYGGYSMGKTNERKALTSALIHNIEEAYWEGYTDALTGMRKK